MAPVALKSKIPLKFVFSSNSTYKEMGIFSLPSLYNDLGLTEMDLLRFATSFALFLILQTTNIICIFILLHFQKGSETRLVLVNWNILNLYLPSQAAMANFPVPQMPPVVTDTQSNSQNRICPSFSLSIFESLWQNCRRSTHRFLIWTFTNILAETQPLPPSL